MESVKNQKRFNWHYLNKKKKYESEERRLQESKQINFCI